MRTTYTKKQGQYLAFIYHYSSGDAGDSWQKFKREFSEIGALAWVPN